MSESPKNWSKLTVSELKEELTSRGLPSTGRKPELLERLLKTEQGEVEEDVLNLEDNTGPDGEDVKKEPENDEECEEEVLVDTGEGQEEGDCVENQQNQDVKEDDEMQAAEEVDQEDETEEVVNPIEEDVQNDEGEQNDEEQIDEEGQNNVEGQINVDLDHQGDDNVNQEEGDAIDKSEVVEMTDNQNEESQVEVAAPMTEGHEQQQSGDLQKPKKTPIVKMPTKQEEEKKLYQPMKFAQFCNWIEQQNRRVKKERSLFIQGVQSKEDMCKLLHEWAQRSTDFCVSYGKNGEGHALLSFLTSMDEEEARTKLTKLLGPKKVLQMAGIPESEASALLTVTLRTEIGFASRSLVLQGIPSEATEDDICLYFPGAKLITHPVKRSEIRVILPDDIEDSYFIEFHDPDSAKAALTEGENIKNTYSKAVLKSMTQYLAEYKEFEAQHLNMILEQAEQNLESNIYSDSERLEMCRSYRGIDAKMGQLKKNPKSNKTEMQKLERKQKDLRKAIDADTDERLKITMSFPEARGLMTPYTLSQVKSVLAKKWNEKNKKHVEKEIQWTRTDIEDNMQNNEKSMAKVVEDVFLGSSARVEKEEVFTGDLGNEISKLMPDENGWFTISVVREKNFDDVESLEKIFSKYGKVRNANLTKKRGYARFGTKREAIAALKDLFGDKQWLPQVPTNNSKYLVLSGAKDTESKKETFVTADVPADQMLAAKALKIRVSNIKLGTTLTRVRQLMMKFGPLGFVLLKNAKGGKMTAEVTFKNPQSAHKALDAKHLKLDNRKLEVSQIESNWDSQAKVSAMKAKSPKPAARSDAMTTPRSNQPPKKSWTSPSENPFHRKIFVKMLSTKTNRPTLRTYFAQFGEVEKIFVFMDQNQESRGMATITYTSSAGSVAAVDHANHFLDGRHIQVTHHKGSKFDPNSESYEMSPAQGQPKSSGQGHRNVHHDQRREKTAAPTTASYDQSQIPVASNVMATSLPGAGLVTMEPFPGSTMQNPFINNPVPMATSFNPTMLGLGGAGVAPMPMMNPAPVTIPPPPHQLLTGFPPQMLPSATTAAPQVGLGGNMVSPQQSTDPYEAQRLGRKERSRAQGDEESSGSTKRQKTSQDKQDAMMGQILKGIGEVISSKMGELGPQGAKSALTAIQEAFTMKRPPSSQQTPAASAASSSSLAGHSRGMQQQVNTQDQVSQQRHQQLNVHKQQEKQLQRELLELQKMKEAVLRETSGYQSYRRK